MAKKKAAKKSTKKTVKKKSARRTGSAAKSTDDGPGIPIGKAAPMFTLKNQAGQSVALKDLRSQWVVLYFYPKDDTPGCTTEACQFRDGLPKFKRSKAVILGVSPDDEVRHRRFIDKYDLNFDLLADPGKKVLEKYGVWREKSMYGRKYMGVVRTTYLIDPQGKVAFRWDKVKVAGHDEAVLEKIRELR